MTFGVQISIGRQGGSYELPPCPITQPVREAGMKTRVYGTVEELPRSTHPRSPLFKDLTEQVFGELTVLHFAGKRGKQSTWACRCACPAQTLLVVFALNLVRGHTSSCGCKAVKAWDNVITIHGLYTQPEMRYLIRTYDGLTARCANPKNANYLDYGGRGITSEFRSLVDFVTYVQDNLGPRPEGCSIDRINNGGNYAPGNLRWATYKEQCRNRRSNILVCLAGQQMTVAEAADVSGVPRKLVYSRLSLGWPIEKALATPITRKNPKTSAGATPC